MATLQTLQQNLKPGYPTNMPLNGSSQFRSLTKRIMQQAVTILATKYTQPLKVLELGCGTGFLFNDYSNPFVNITGIDPQSHLLSQCQYEKKFIGGFLENSLLYFANKRKQIVSNSSFDLLISLDTLVHLTNESSQLRTTEMDKIYKLFSTVATHQLHSIHRSASNLSEGNWSFWNYKNFKQYDVAGNDSTGYRFLFTPKTDKTMKSILEKL